MTGNNSTGISTQDISPTEVLTDSLIHFKDGLDLEINNGTAISAFLTRSKVQIDGNSRIITNGSNAIEAIEGQVSINGKSTIIGDIEAVNTGNVSLSLSSGSSVTGTMNNYTVTPPSFWFHTRKN